MPMTLPIGTGRYGNELPNGLHIGPGATVRTLVVTQNITADGSIEMLGDWFDPQRQADQADLIEEVHRQDSRSDGFITGRHTFESLRSYWPEQSEDATGITKSE
jgi:dihydrofolate reductase